MGSRHLTSPSPAHTACGSTSRGQVCHPEASWRCTLFTGDTRSSPGTLDCVPIGRPDICRWVAGISACKPAAKTYHVPRQQPQDRSNNLCNTSYSHRATQLILHRAVVIGRQRGQKSCRRSAVRERGAPSTHNHHGPDLVSIHIFIQENVSTGNTLVPCAINFDWTALFGVAVFGGC